MRQRLHDIIADCERGIDTDGDGFSSAVDCNDATASILPGAPEIFGNGVDEDCNGRDDANLDVDGDGFPRPLDCDDANAAIRPGRAGDPRQRGRRELRPPRRAVGGLGAVGHQPVGARRPLTRLRTLVVRLRAQGRARDAQLPGPLLPVQGAPSAAPSRSDLPAVVFTRLPAAPGCAPATRITLTITAPETIGRIYTYAVKRGALPDPRDRVPRAGRRRRGRSC